MSVAKALSDLCPGAVFNVRGDTYEGIEWLDANQAKPSKDDVLAKVEALAYREKRAAEYPDIKDQLDALWKGGTAFDEMKALIMAVKAKYPKAGE